MKGHGKGGGLVVLCWKGGGGSSGAKEERPHTLDLMMQFLHDSKNDYMEISTSCCVVLNCTLKQLQIYDPFREAFKDLAGHYDLALKIAPLFVVFRI